MRNVLYHIMYKPCGTGKWPLRNSDDIFDDIARQMNDIVAPNGLVVFAESEDILLDKPKMIMNVMKKYGFEPLYKEDPYHIYKKSNT